MSGKTFGSARRARERAERKEAARQILEWCQLIEDEVTGDEDRRTLLKERDRYYERKAENDSN